MNRGWPYAVVDRVVCFRVRIGLAVPDSFLEVLGGLLGVGDLVSVTVWCDS